MKRRLFSTVLVLAVFNNCFAQEEKEHPGITPPAAVKTAFEKQFPGVLKVKWGKEGKTGYEAGFMQNNTEMSAVFDAKGMLQETEMGIKEADLPQVAAAYVKTHYKGAKIKEAAKITKAGGAINYEAEVNGKDLIFDEAGKFIKSVKD